MHIQIFTVGPFSENTYLLSKNNKALLIDPGFYEDTEFEQFKDELESKQLELTAVVLTHAHVDHVLGLRRVLNHFDVPVYLSDKDRSLWDNFEGQAVMFGLQAHSLDVQPKVLPEQQNWQIGPFTFDTLYTPGHAPDHISLYSKEYKIVIAGDTLFREGIGRTDLYKGDFELLAKSIRKKLYKLPDDTEVYPGHGSSTTIGHEKGSNPYVSAEADNS